MNSKLFAIAEHTVPKLEKSIRLYDYCTTIFKPNIPSRKGIKKALKRGEIYVNDKIGHSGNWVKEGQKIELRDLELNPPQPYELQFDIIFEDNDMAIINKPAGISVSGNQFKTIQNAIINKIKKTTALDALKWPRPVHRLDNQTSGILVIAKTIQAIMKLSKQFEERTITKKYQAIVMGDPENEGEINFPIEGQVALSTFEKIKTINSLQSKKLSLIQLSPKTGRTHQLRIHCSKSGFPILGDKKYGVEGNILLHKGLFLAAVQIELNHPITGEQKIIKINTPNKFENLLKREARRWEKHTKEKTKQ